MTGDFGDPRSTPPGSLPGSPLGSQGGRSHLVAGARLTGDLTAPGLVEVAGQVEGRVSADAVVIEAVGVVRGEVGAGQVAVRGAFDGRLSGGDVRLQATARVTGEVVYETLTIEAGAEVTARFDRAPPPAPDPDPGSAREGA